MMVGLSDGKVEMYGARYRKTFEATPEGALDLIRAAEKEPTLHMSSSCDFPEEEGLPEDFDIDQWIDSGYALINRAIEILQGDRDI